MKIGNSPKVKGDKKDTKLFHEVDTHYQMAKEDLDVRRTDWDKTDELFRSHIDESNWPYNSVVFDPRTFTAIFEKTSRLFANKLRGRLVPREGGDALGAKINNELLEFQWDDNERVEQQSMLEKWSLMDQNARKYGASFALCKWRYERQVVKGDDKKKKSVPYYDGPDFKPLVNRDCLPNPSYSNIKQWFQYREYLTLEELEGVNDAARSKPIYKNLHLLKQSIKDGDEKSTGDSRESNYISRDKSIKGLRDFLGSDPFNKVIEVVTEYRRDRWITFAPKHGVILRDIPNPYDHNQIPVVMLKYYSIDDDLYGMSEIEPVESQQRAINALINQYLDSINMSLYTPLKVRATGVQMHTLEFGPGAKWIMNDPATDIIPHEASPKGISEFGTTYRFLVGAMQEGLGETSAATSNLDPTSPEKTATEVKDMAMQRKARDNFNQIFLSSALKKQMVFWLMMNKQFLLSDTREQAKVIRIVGRESIRYFEKMGLGGFEVPDESIETITQPGETSDLLGQGIIKPQDFEMPQYPVDVEGETLPKFALEEGGEVGHLIITPDDLSGYYDYIPDVESMSLPNDEQLAVLQSQLINFARRPEIFQQLQQEGHKIKLRELLEDFFEKNGMKDATKYFDKADPNAQTFQRGEGRPAGGEVGQGVVRNPGMG